VIYNAKEHEPLGGGSWDERLARYAIADIVDSVPAEWLGEETEFADERAQRRAYVTYLVERLSGPQPWLAEAIAATARPQPPLSQRLSHRVD